MKSVVFLFVFLFSSVVAFCNTDTTATPTPPFSENFKVLKNGTESKVDSVVEKNSEIFIYIDGGKTPVKKNNKKFRNTPTPTPDPDSLIVKFEEKEDSSTVITAGTNSDTPWWFYVLSALGIGFIGFALFKASSNGTKDSSKTEPSNPSSDTTTPSAPSPETDDRFTPAVSPDHAPAFPNMPSRENLNVAALPQLMQRAYANTPNFLRNNGVITDVSDVKIGKLNGRFSMEHADGSVSTQNFNNELGFRAKARLSNGKSMIVYSRFSCMNNVRGIEVAEISEMPTFQEEEKSETNGRETVTTVYQPEPVPTEIQEVQSAPESSTTTPANIVVDTLPTEADPTVTVEIDGRSVTAPLSVINMLLKK